MIGLFDYLRMLVARADSPFLKRFLEDSWRKAGKDPERFIKNTKAALDRWQNDRFVIGVLEKAIEEVTDGQISLIRTSQGEYEFQVS